MKVSKIHYYLTDIFTNCFRDSSLSIYQFIIPWTALHSSCPAPPLSQVPRAPHLEHTQPILVLQSSGKCPELTQPCPTLSQMPAQCWAFPTSKNPQLPWYACSSAQPHAAIISFFNIKSSCLEVLVGASLEPALGLPESLVGSALRPFPQKMGKQLHLCPAHLGDCDEVWPEEDAFNSFNPE